MSKVIPLHNQSYLQFLKQSREILRQAEEDLFIEAINLCSCKCWKEWTEDKDDGVEFEFDTDMIKVM